MTSADLMHSMIFDKKREALLAGDWDRARALQDLDSQWHQILDPPRDRPAFGFPFEGLGKYFFKTGTEEPTPAGLWIGEKSGWMR